MVHYAREWRLWYDFFAFGLTNGALIVTMYFGFDYFYSEKNDCDNHDSTALLNSLMFVILFVGYFFCFMYFMIACTMPCLYCIVRDQAENNRLRAGGVGQSQVPMILASLSRTQYNPDLHNHEKNCIICLVDYEENDVVTQLRCDPRHYFHTSCVEGWVK